MYILHEAEFHYIAFYLLNYILNFIKFRKTIRNFKDKDIENDKLLKIIEAGRFTQTGSNSQNVSYVVVKDKIAELRDLVLETLKNIGEYIL